MPATPVLGRNYPNPFNASTIISFSIPQTFAHSIVELAVYDVQGKMIRHLLRRKLSEGNYAVRWDAVMENGMQASSGTYFYHLIVGDHRQVGKMSLVK
jgi:flagellar hook assembly protein FlgD